MHLKIRINIKIGFYKRTFESNENVTLILCLPCELFENMHFYQMKLVQDLPRKFGLPFQNGKSVAVIFTPKKDER